MSYDNIILIAEADRLYVSSKKYGRRMASIKKCERIEQLNLSGYIKRRMEKIAKY